MMTVGEVVERLIYIKDKSEFKDIKDIEALNAACNILDHKFNRSDLPDDIINE